MSNSNVIDKGRIVAAVDQYPEKVNGQVVMIQGSNQPKMKNKWMAIGEATKWQHQDGSISESRKVYLQPVSTKGAFFEEKTFWDSEQQNQQQQQQAPQQMPQQQNGYQQQPQQQQAPQQSYNQAKQGGGFM